MIMLSKTLKIISCLKDTKGNRTLKRLLTSKSTSTAIWMKSDIWIRTELRIMKKKKRKKIRTDISLTKWGLPNSGTFLKMETRRPLIFWGSMQTLRSATLMGEWRASWRTLSLSGWTCRGMRSRNGRPWGTSLWRSSKKIPPWQMASKAKMKTSRRMVDIHNF